MQNANYQRFVNVGEKQAFCLLAVGGSYSISILNLYGYIINTRTNISYPDSSVGQSGPLGHFNDYIKCQKMKNINDLVESRVKDIPSPAQENTLL